MAQSPLGGPRPTHRQRPSLWKRQYQGPLEKSFIGKGSGNIQIEYWDDEPKNQRQGPSFIHETRNDDQRQ
jgi:hypothetical protein